MNGTRTFGRKSVRMSSAEHEALEIVLPHVLIKDGIFTEEGIPSNRPAPLYLEIGFGNGEFLYESALKNPGHDFIGIEVFMSGVAKLLRRMTGYDNSKLPYPHNIRVIIGDARHALEEYIPTRSLDGIYILFPDPWPRKRHHKRRLITGGFATLLHTRLKDNGFVVTVTDHKVYAAQISESFLYSGYTITEGEGLSGITGTKYAIRAMNKGRRLFICRFQKGVESSCLITG